jgi:hypothetical protein
MGLDLSVRGAAAVVVNQNGEVFDHGVWGWGLARNASVKERIERMVYIARKIIGMGRRALQEDDGLQIAIEQYAFRMQGAQNDLGEIQGTVKSQIWLALGLVPSIIVASSARKTVLGKGRFSKGKKGKREIIEAVCERGFETSDDNVADAYVIAECLRLKSKELKYGYEGKEEEQEGR